MPNTYNTKQRELLLTYLKENSDRHVSVEDIAEYLSAQGTAVGKSTIYRRLERLVEDGTVQRFFIGEGSGSCFQYTGGGQCAVHYHFKCTDCGALLHLECDELDRLSEHMLRDHGFRLDSAKTSLYGLCEKCRKNHEGK